jgi:hypothetical protein
MKINFFYIKEENARKSNFKALEFKKEFYPIMDEDSNEIFIKFIGRKKINEKRIREIPFFNLEIENWENYAKKYGKRCLFYSLTGKDLDSDNCCDLSEIREFLSLANNVKELKIYNKFIDTIKEIQKIQNEKLDKLPKEIIWPNKDSFLFFPSYSFLCLITSPMMDTPMDDSKMEKLFKRTKYIGLQESLSYSEKLKIVDDSVNDEKEFPIAMYDRITYLYGKNCQELYSKALELVNLM